MPDLRLSAIGDMTGRVALVTGGGTGIGLMIAQGLAANGAKVYITGRRMEILEKAAEEEIEGSNTRLIPLRMDVTDKDDIRSAVKFMEETDGKLDVLVNNAGVVGPYSSFITDCSAPEHKDTSTLGRSLFERESFDGWGDAFRINTAAVYFVTTAFLGLLERGANSEGKGETSSIINISSTMAHSHLSMNMFAYVATKAATDHLTKTMATEFARQRIPIRVNAIAPGLFSSELTGDAEFVAKKASARDSDTSSTAPILRAGRQEEMAMTALYLASSAGGFTNGVSAVVDGGFRCVNP